MKNLNDIWLKINIQTWLSSFTIADASVRWPYFCRINGLELWKSIYLKRKKGVAHLLCCQRKICKEIGMISSDSRDTYDFRNRKEVSSKHVVWDFLFGITKNKWWWWWTNKLKRNLLCSFFSPLSHSSSLMMSRKYDLLNTSVE